MVGDGHTTLRHCEFARDEDCEGKEPDAGPVYCVAIVTEPTGTTTVEDAEELVAGILYGGTAMTIGSCKRQANMIVAALADRGYLSNKGRPK